ncbi:MAG: phage tail spike protein [Oscillospiraceae bacterium]|nr:phage tail spike protein [Oscillospiraceae bacterium]
MAEWYSRDGAPPYKLAWPTIDLPHKKSDLYIADKKHYESRAWQSMPGLAPYKSCWPSLYDFCKPIQQNEYICVFDMNTAQGDFNTNGLAILSCATSCITTEKLNSSYDLELRHPIDDIGKWAYIQELNIIKADGQLFRIYRARKEMNEDGSAEIAAYCRHIFYDLTDKLLIDVRPTDQAGQGFINWIMCNIFDDDPDNTYTKYNYSYYSDIQSTATSYYQGISPVAALIGADNCFINRLGGELYRDNFYFSINSRKEKSTDNAFNIMYGRDMLKVVEDIDYTDFCTHLRVNDNFGNFWAVSYVALPQIHHNVTKSITLNYETNDPDQMIKDGQAYFNSVCVPKLTYEVIFANIENDKKYEGFMSLKNRNVGDVGNIFCQKLGIDTEQKVISKQKDILNQKTISIELGNMRSSLTRRDKFAEMMQNTPAGLAIAKKLHATQLKMLKTWGDAEDFTWAELEEFRWGELS